MRIAQVAPVWERVPPRKYGGIEIVVSLLTEELVRMKQDITLFATGDSKTKAKLRSVYHTPAPGEILHDPFHDLHHTTMAFEVAKDFDIIHNHAGYAGVSLANFVKTPVITTLHGAFDDINYPFYKAFGKSCYYNSISDEQRRQGPKMNYSGTIYNAIDFDSYPFSEKKKDYYVYVSRMSQIKGSDIVVKIAKKAGIKLIMAGRINPGKDVKFFEEKVHPHIDGKQIIYEGEVSETEKRHLFRDAKAFIFPLQWAEPFGLVMPEAMACGTPVIAFPYGSVPEVVDEGITGFVTKTEAEMVKAVKKVDEIDPYKCRDHARSRFGIKRMAQDYLATYKKILGKG